MKNVSLIEAALNKRKTWKLVDKNGNGFKSFTIFSNLITKKYSPNTSLSYSRNIALFIDYLEEAQELFKNKDFTKFFLVEVIEAFSEWLLYGDKSGNGIALTIHKTYPSPKYSKQTINLIMTSVRLFLKLSERIRVEQEDIFLTDDMLFPEINSKHLAGKNTKNSLIKNSMLAGVISGGPQLLKVCILPIIKSTPYFSVERAFPFDKIITFLDSFTTYRDKALYALCAASGCRMHEALQILIEDVDLKNRSINLVDPYSRITKESYVSLTAEEKNKLCWKGRQTNTTILIQPLGDLFFEYLEQYIKKEYTHHNKHSFIFQHVRGRLKGKPFFLSASATRHEAFEKAATKVDVVEQLNQGPHSLRHMYGTYLVNYFPKSDGSFGLPISIVQKIMGHSTVAATQKYARHDKELISVELEYANSLLYNPTDINVSLLDMKKKALQSQILELESQYNAL